MSKNVILRPVCNRPEMLYLSIEYEKRAREYHNFSSDLFTIFLVEHGADNKTVELVNSYPFSKTAINRTTRFGLSINILTGMKTAFDLTEDYIIYVEDDVLLHETYFKYMDLLLSMDVGKYSALSPYYYHDKGDVNEIYRSNYYSPLAPLITKEFFKDYVEPCITPVYYETFATRDRFVRALNDKYKEYWGKGYYYTNGEHNEQAGLHRRLYDIALIEEDKAVIMPKVNRQQHIGFYGKNRPGGIIPGTDFDMRLKNLREIIKDDRAMYNLSTTKQYDDYRIFSPKLNDWDGTVYVKR